VVDQQKNPSSTTASSFGNPSMTVLDWKDQSTWLHAVDAYAGDILDSTVREHVLRRRSYCDSDDLTWLPSRTIQPSFVDAFVHYYSSIRAFHGCRPLDVATYSRNGFVGHAAERLKKEFLDRFPHVPDEILRLAAQELDISRATERAKTWFVLTERELTENCGSYIIHGSEYLAALAKGVSRLLRGIDYFYELQNTGYPTIIEVELPVSYLPVPQLNSIAREILSAWGRRITKLGTSSTSTPCVSIHQSLEPQYVVGHTHPKEVRDPYRMLRRAMSPTTCPSCRASKA